MIPVRSRSAPGRLQPIAFTRRKPAVAEEDWTDSWVCVGFADQLAQDGDVLPATISRHPLHVRRAAGGEFVAAFNARPFGGCMSIPLQCAGARKIRCPHLACAFSEDPGVLGDLTDPDGQARRQFVGADPDRLVEVPLTRCGPLLLVRVATADEASAPPPMLAGGSGDSTLDSARATEICQQDLALGWRSGARKIADALAGHLGIERLVEQTAAQGRVTLSAHQDTGRLTCHLIWPNLVLAESPGEVRVALLRPTGPGRCSVLSAVLRPADGALDDPAARTTRGGSGTWREVVAAAASG